jgi:adenylate cyclase
MCCRTIYFSDIEGVTRISEHLTPIEIVDNLAEYLAAMTDTIREHQGTGDKFIGDGIMAFWNAPNEVLGWASAVLTTRRTTRGRSPRR